ncbi:uncharacterized protein LOC144129433 isoform X2 [Amblyomma americanum]
MATRVYINVDLDPFCTELVFPKGLDVGGFVSLVFGRFSLEGPRATQDKGVRHISLRTSGRTRSEDDVPVNKKVFISVPYGERNPLCTLRDAPLPDDLEDIPDASDDEAVDDLILGSGNVDDKRPSKPVETPNENAGLLCPSCGGWFASSEVLLLHKAMSHSRNSAAKPNGVKTLYGCTVCKQTFPTSAECLLHKWKHRPESEWPFQCKSCQRGFIRQAAFVRHQQSHSFECKECNRSFSDQKELQEHNMTHQHGRETFLCVHCEQLFLSKAGLQRHTQRYHKNTPAGTTTGDGANDVDGMDPETAPEAAAVLDSIPVALSCDQCTFGCSQPLELAQHVASNHPAVPIFRCEKCEQPFLKEAERDEHMQLKHQLLHVEPTSDGNYVCQICDRRLKTFSGYWGHLRGHTKTKPFLCDQCGHRYTSRGSLTKHKRTHDFANATKCPHCSKEFATLDYMRNHERLVHTRNFKFSCRLCGHKFPNERKQQTHMAVVHEQELTPEELKAMTRVRHLRCPDCSFATYSALQFRQHQATHTGRYPFSCTQCERAFAFRFQLTLHMRRQHRPGGPLVCPHCPRHFVAEDAHATHVALHGAPHASGLECSHCKRLYETPRLLEKHQASAHGPRDNRFTCSLCNKRFRTSNGVVAHRRVAHTDSGGAPSCKTAAQQAALKNWAHRPGRKYGCSRWKHSCEPCGRFFKFESSLRAHRVFFHGIEGQAAEDKLCPECGKAFQTELSLAMHLRTHTLEVNFKCSVCSKIYRSRCSLKKHIATTHRSSLRVFCAVCNRGFLNHASMVLHAKFAHKDNARASAAVEVTSASQSCPIASTSLQTVISTTVTDSGPATAAPIPAVTTVSDLTAMASVQDMIAVPTVSSIQDLEHSETVDIASASIPVSLPVPASTPEAVVEMEEPSQEITELTRMEPGSQEHAAVEQLFASIQQPTVPVSGEPPLTVVGSAQHMLHMLSVSQVEEVVSDVCMTQNDCPGVW